MKEKDLPVNNLPTLLDFARMENALGTLSQRTTWQNIKTLFGVTDCLLPTQTQVVYVNKGGNDLTGNGSICKPFLTIAKAILSIADNTSAKMYTIRVSAGTYVEANILIKPFVFIIGDSRDNTFLQVNGTLGFDPSFNGAVGTARTGFKDFRFLPMPLTASFNLNLIGGLGTAVLYLEHCSFPFQIFWFARNDNDTLQVENCFFFTTNTFAGGNIYISNTYSDGGYLINTTGAGGNSMYVDFNSTYTPAGNITIDNLTFADLNFNFFGGQCNGAMLVNTAGGVNVVNLHVDKLPANYTQGVAVNFDPASNSKGVRYTAGNLVDWSGVNPYTLQNALDRIASKITPIP